MNEKLALAELQTYLLVSSQSYWSDAHPLETEMADMGFFVQRAGSFFANGKKGALNI